MLRMIAGFEQPTSGRIVLDGADVTQRPPFDRDVNTVFQDYALFPHMTVAQNVEYGLKVRSVPKSERRNRVVEALATVRLESFGERKPNQLSGGQRQRVALARALVNRPRVLLLDEPLGALDRKLREEMQVELKQIQRDVGITFVFVTHDQGEALTMSNRIAVFNHGRIEQVGGPEEIYERPVSEFVAGFVGTSNLLEGAAARAVLGIDGAYTVRPEKIRLLDPAASDGPRGRRGDRVRHGARRAVPRERDALPDHARRGGPESRRRPEPRGSGPRWPEARPCELAFRREARSPRARIGTEQHQPANSMNNKGKT